MNRNFLFGVVVVIMNLCFAQNGQAQHEPIPTKLKTVVFTPQGDKIVTAGENNLIQIWNRDGKIISSFKMDPKPLWGSEIPTIQKMAVSPDGKIIVVACNNQKVYFYRSNGDLITEKGRDSNFEPFIRFNKTGDKVFLAYRHLVKVEYDTLGTQLHELTFDPESNLPYDKRTNKELIGMEVTKSDDFLFLYQVTINPKKYYFEYHLSEYSKSNRFLGSTKLELNQSIRDAQLSYRSDHTALIYAYGLNDKGSFRESLYYNMNVGRIDKIQTPRENNLSLEPESKNYVAAYKYVFKRFDDQLKELPNIQVPFDSASRAIYSPDFSLVVGVFENKLPRIFDFKTSKIYDFDNINVAQDNYTFNPVLAQGTRNVAVHPVQNEVKPQFDFSGFKLFSPKNDLMINELAFDVRWNSSGKYHFWDFKGGQVIQGLGNSEATLWNTEFSADMSFLLPKGSTAVTGAWVTFVFWRREENKTKGIYEYSVSVNSIGEVTVARVMDGVHQEWIKKNLMGINITDKVFDRMVVSVDKKGELSCKLYSKNDEPKELKTTIYSPSKEPFMVFLDGTDPKFSVAQFTSLKLEGTNIAAKAFPKTLQTTLTGCIAGDCFDGFGYVINDQKEEFCGYFSSGVKENIGQMHRPEEQLTYTGFFNAEIPNGFSLVKYYDRELSELGFFTNYMPDGEMTTYDRYNNMKNAMYKGDNITAIKLTTGCLSGDCQNGNGVYQKENGTRFIGDFVGGKIVKGVVFDDKSRVVRFDSLDKDGNLHGKASVFKSNGEVIYGDFVHGAMQGNMLIKSPVGSKTLFVEGKFENSIGVNITVQFRDGRKWVGKQDSFNAEWATGKGTMTYTDGTTKTGKFNAGEFLSE